ncbi:hypothetical protein CHLNCDRAFT_31542 [Chlorella variabilis]|uniref:Coatomer subunit gamma n=1 Tax=Chlorella variabilis TaxID=554065 RepID=E1ZH84_CHLVA|nr:hypothetical protein CHLNCDRAFT_31542 [Chlorella variabilis]EFN55078.1 hypothetical protein CHLNCDRAFT_31542 [Chlorella variabilis]|eukprot:XP_005847180.1 hypothetical protein CHLNCDRAFT_31542 [Chlorella variabilis]
MASTAQNTLEPLRAGGDSKAKDEDMEEELEYSPFYGIEKGAVLQEARCFNDSHVDPRRCQQVITKLLYLLTQGESFTKAEASEVFFSVTKLFQHKDVHLRRMVYLVIKEIIPSSDEVIIITSSLMKDMNSKNDLYRANAIRVLCRIIDSQMLLQIERYLKQAVVDKSAVVASAVLAGAIHLAGANSEVIKRWSNEVQEAINSRHPMVQFQAVALMHALRANDRLAVSKLVTQLTRSNVRSPMGQCLLVRYVAQVIAESQPGVGNEVRPFYDFLESCLRHKSEVVIFEAARAICNMRDVTTRELTPAVTVLQLFLSSSKPVLRFVAVRTLNKVAMSHPMAVTNCNIDMESLIADPNRSIATLAITTLLKTGNESSIDRLLKQIGGFMSEIADEFKVVVVEAIKALCLKFPQKYRGLMNFLSNVLREDGGFEYKKAIVDAILVLIRDIPEAKEMGLAQLCEFIEDCEFTFLSVQILHLMGEEGPRTKDPARYIRYIYNRVILENATVRAAALSSLARFGAHCPDLRDRILMLIKRALYDNDDEASAGPGGNGVRDRATLYLYQLQEAPEGPESVDPHWRIPAKGLEAALQAYLASPDQEEPFDLSSVPEVVAPSPAKAKAKPQGLAAAVAAGLSNVSGPETQADEYADMLKAVPQLAALGPVFKTCSPVQLTEEETEYKVVCVRHVLEGHIVFQFNCTNTVREQVLEDVSVTMDLADAEEFSEEAVLPLKVMPGVEEGPGQTYVVLARPPGSMALGRFLNILRFRIKEIDPTTGEAEEEGYEDEYQLEDVEVAAADYIKPAFAPNFRAGWDALPEESEMVDDYGIGQRDSLQDAVEAVGRILGMQACEGTDAVPPNARSHTLLLSGIVVGDVQVLVRLSFGIDAQRNVAMKLAVRSESADVSEAIHAIIQEA